MSNIEWPDIELNGQTIKWENIDSRKRKRQEREERSIQVYNDIMKQLEELSYE